MDELKRDKYPLYYDIMENGDRAIRVKQFLQGVKHNNFFLHKDSDIVHAITDILNQNMYDESEKAKFIDMLGKFLLKHFNFFDQKLKNVLEKGTIVTGRTTTYIDDKHQHINDIIKALGIVRSNIVESWGGNRKSRKASKRKTSRRKTTRQNTRRNR